MKEHDVDKKRLVKEEVDKLCNGPLRNSDISRTILRAVVASALEGNTISTAELKKKVYPNRRERDAENTLREAIRRLRKQLADYYGNDPAGKWIKIPPADGYTADFYFPPSPRAEGEVEPVTPVPPTRWKPVTALLLFATGLVLVLIVWTVWPQRPCTGEFRITSLKDGDKVGGTERIRVQRISGSGCRAWVVVLPDSVRGQWAEGEFVSNDAPIFANFGDPTTKSGEGFTVEVWSTRTNLPEGLISRIPPDMKRSVDKVHVFRK